MNPGYVYVLMNASLPDIVKVGMTTRDPEDRVHELSSATGVPTPFILIYKKYFSNCHLAEKMVHEVLRDSRLSTNREFFSISPHEAINIIQSLELTNNELDDDEETTSASSLSVNQQLIEDMLEKADAYYNGEGNVLQDFPEAMKLYKKAADFNSPEAYYHLGGMYYSGEGCKVDKHLAIQTFQKSGNLGNRKAYAQLAIYFTIDVDIKNISNSLKCWSNYFDILENEWEHDYSDYYYASEYIMFCQDNELEINYVDIISPFVDEVLDHINHHINRYENSNVYEAWYKERMASKLHKAKNFIELVIV